MMGFLAVGAGGALGAMARHGVNLLTLRAFGPGFPVGTLAVNIIGSFAMGLFIAWLARHGTGGSMLRLFVATGIFGGFTTFSAFSLDAVLLFERGETMLASGYIIGSVVLSLLALVAGLAIMRAGFLA
ncbi:MAG: fluoride efflux transporter CrcB [Pseudomonadota bacterium]